MSERDGEGMRKTEESGEDGGRLRETEKAAEGRGDLRGTEEASEEGRRPVRDRGGLIETDELREGRNK